MPTADKVCVCVRKEQRFLCSAAWKEYQGLNLCVRVQSMCMNV